MAAALPDGIRIVPTPRGTTWRLPIRPAENKRSDMIFMLFFTTFWCGFVGIFAYKVVTDFGAVNGVVSLLSKLLMLVFLLPFAAVGLVLLFICFVGFSPSYSEVSVDDEWLTNVEHGGWFNLFRWTTRRRIADVTHIRVAVPEPPRRKSRLSGESETAWKLRQMEDRKKPRPESILASARHAKKDMKIAPGYGREILVPLAYVLAEKCSTNTATILSAEHSTSGPSVEVAPPVEQIPAPAEPEFNKPATSDVIVLKEGGVTTIVLPPAGFRRNAAGLLIFGLIWCGMLLFVTIGVLGKGLRAHESGFPLAVLALFWLVGLLFLTGSFQTARKKTVIVVTSSELLILQQGPLWRSEKRYAIGEIEDIATKLVHDSESNKTTVQMQLHIKDRLPFPILYERPEEELPWLAQELKLALKPRGSRVKGVVA